MLAEATGNGNVLTSMLRGLPNPKSRQHCNAMVHSLRQAMVQEGGNIAPALSHSHDLYGSGCGAVDDEVSANRPKQNRVTGQVLALMAYAGRVADGFKGIEEPGYPLIRGVNIVLGDIVPDAIQVPVGIIAQDILCHILAFRRCSDLRFSRARASAGETC